MNKRIKRSISATKLITVGLFTICIAEFIFLIRSYKATAEDEAFQTALSTARHTANSIRELRKYYTGNIISTVLGHTKMKVTHEFKSAEFDSTGAVPLPATFAIEYAKAISDENTEVRLVSSYPFPWRKDRKFTEFDAKAEGLFREFKDSTSYYEVDKGTNTLFYAIPDKMVNATCVNCHNSHAASPKKDWNLNEVRGIVSITTPIGSLERSENKYIFIIIGTILLLILVIYRIYSQSNFSIKNISNAIEFLSRGKLLNSEIPLKDKSLEPVAAKVTDLSNYLSDASGFAEKIGKGEFAAQFSKVTEDDNLKNSLLKMRDNLLKTEAEEKKRNWVTIGISQMGEVLRKNNNSIDNLCNDTLTFIVKYLKANQGCIFVAEVTKEETYLELKGCYAYDRKKFLEKRVSPGEGLIGQAFLEKETIHLTEIPESYVSITSGLGDANPNSILIVPLIHNEEIVGMIELAGFNKFETHQIEFVQKIAESIASSIVTVKVNDRTTELLKISQQQSEEMRSQEEEMRQNMEEMQATQEEMKRQNQVFAMQLKEKDTIIEQLEKKVKKIT